MGENSFSFFLHKKYFLQYPKNMGYLMKMPMRTIQKILADHQKKCSPLDDKFGRKIRYCTSGFKSLTFSIASSTLPH